MRSRQRTQIVNCIVKLLFDQNISFRVAIKLKHLFPDCDQVRTLQLENKSDIEI